MVSRKLNDDLNKRQSTVRADAMEEDSLLGGSPSLVALWNYIFKKEKFSNQHWNACCYVSHIIQPTKNNTKWESSTTKRISVIWQPNQCQKLGFWRTLFESKKKVRMKDAEKAHVNFLIWSSVRWIFFLGEWNENADSFTS